MTQLKYSSNAASLKSAYESNADTNALTDTRLTRLLRPYQSAVTGAGPHTLLISVVNKYDDSGAAGMTLRLPASPTDGDEVHIKETGNSTNPVTITTAAGTTDIEPATGGSPVTSDQLSIAGLSAVYKWDNGSSVWRVISSKVSASASSVAIFADMPHSSPETEDDEFPGPSVDVKWSVWDASAAGLHSFSITAQNQLRTVNTGNGTVNWGGLYQAVPGSEYVVYTKSSCLTLNANAVYGLVVTQDLDASPTTADFISISSLNTGPRMRSHTSFSSGVSELGTYTGSTLPVPTYSRLRVNGTSVEGDISFDGKMWLNLGATTLSGITHFALAGEVFTNLAVFEWRFEFVRVISGSGTSGFDATILGGPVS